MGDLTSWLGAVHKGCAALCTPLGDDYGAEEAEDLLALTPEEVEALVRTLKPIPARKFRAALEALAIDAALPGDAAGAGPKSIPEAVPPDKEPIVDLHTVGTFSPAASEPMDGGTFFSLRFGAEHGVVPMAKQLQGAMAQRGEEARIIDMMAGGDIDATVFRSIEECGTFVVFGSAQYGEDTGNQACTYYEYKHAHDRKKRIILIRMIPFDQDFEHLQARVIFGANKLVIPWMLGTPMPADLPDQILRAMGVASPEPARPDIEPEDEAGAPGMDVGLAAERAQLQAQQAQLQAQQAQAAAAQSEQRAALEAQAAQMKAQAAALQRQQSELRQQSEALAQQQQRAAAAKQKAEEEAASLALAQRLQAQENAAAAAAAAAVVAPAIDSLLVTPAASEVEVEAPAEPANPFAITEPEPEPELLSQDSSEEDDASLVDGIATSMAQRLRNEASGGAAVMLRQEDVTRVAKKAKEIFMSQPPLLELAAPVNIVGSIHGEFGNLLQLLDFGGFPPMSNYLFLGNYIDFGKQSIETVLLLLCLKIKYPENIFLLRGNHETSQINRIYGFYDECTRRYNMMLWRKFNDCFNCLPFAAIVEDKLFCVHGGLSPSLSTMEQLRQIQRPTEVSEEGLLCDLLWSRPKTGLTGWEDDRNGVSAAFGEDSLTQFLAKHDFDLVIRGSGEAIEHGYEFFANRQLVSVFTVPMWSEVRGAWLSREKPGTISTIGDVHTPQFDNAGAFMCCDDDLMCGFKVLKQRPSASPSPSQEVDEMDTFLDQENEKEDPDLE